MTAPALFRTIAILATLVSTTAGAHALAGIDGGSGGLSHARIEGPARTDAASEPMLFAQADCSAAAAQAAAQTGGEVLSVQATDQGGQTVCVVTVLIPGQGGERPRRTTVTLPG